MVEAPGLHPQGHPWGNGRTPAPGSAILGAAPAQPQPGCHGARGPRTTPSELANAATEPSDIKKSSYLRTMDLG